ncbi:MAG: hypothetical protein AB7I42_23010 [Bradyrhizobium sp.]|uniref:hypothetical protein n=1 Tax=Bradyrhizobium sp. TaxID=376 RepID=UPI003D09AC5B
MTYAEYVALMRDTSQRTLVALIRQGEGGAHTDADVVRLTQTAMHYASRLVLDLVRLEQQSAQHVVNKQKERELMATNPEGSA